MVTSVVCIIHYMIPRNIRKWFGGKKKFLESKLFNNNTAATHQNWVIFDKIVTVREIYINALIDCEIITSNLVLMKKKPKPQQLVDFSRCVWAIQRRCYYIWIKCMLWWGMETIDFLFYVRQNNEPINKKLCFFLPIACYDAHYYICMVTGYVACAFINDSNHWNCIMSILVWAAEFLVYDSFWWTIFPSCFKTRRTKSVVFSLSLSLFQLTLETS